MLISLCVGVDSGWRVWLDPVVWCGYDCWVVGSTPIPAVTKGLDIFRATRIGPFPPSVDRLVWVHTKPG